MPFRKKLTTSKNKGKAAISRRAFTKVLGVTSLSLGVQPLFTTGSAKASIASRTAQTPVNELQNMIVNQLKSHKKLSSVNGEALDHARQDAEFQHHLGKQMFQLSPMNSVKN